MTAVPTPSHRCHAPAANPAIALGLALALQACAIGRTPDWETYVVQPGDTLSQIAAARRTTTLALIQANRDQYPRLAETNGRLIVAGWKLMVPAGSARPAAAETPALIADDGDLALTVIALANAERAGAGLPPLAVDDGLMAIAQRRAVEIASDYSHAGLGDDCAACGENIAQGPRGTTPARMLERWMASDGHRANILRDGVARTGAAVYRTPEGVVFAVQVFAY
jgi:uncharacterized protein YkwD